MRILPLFLVLAACAAAARAEVRRLALFIGVDQGLSGEARLRYAAQDAKAMEALFRQSGLYRPEDVTLLANADLDGVRHAMERLGAESSRLKAEGGPVQVFVYFSGHGDAHSLHVRGRKLMRDDLVAWLNGLPSELKIVVLDACESGDFLRSKGGRFLQDLPTRNDENLKSHGVVLISSTSRGEVAQESDGYRGAVFTHHLVNGLRGLADFSGDGWVSLQEAFEYSRRATAIDAAMSGALEQNPSFDLDLVGGSDPGIIPIDRRKGWIRLRHFPSGPLAIFDAHSLNLIADIWLTGADSLTYRIASGSYVFRFREGGREYLHASDVGSEGGADVERGNFREKVSGTWTSKGGFAVRAPGIETGFGFPHPFARAPASLFRAGWLERTADGKASLGFGIGSATSSDPSTALSSRIAWYQLAGRKTWFLGGTRRLHAMAGGMAGFDWVRQEIRDGRFGGGAIPTISGDAPAVRESSFPMLQAGVPFELEWNVYGALWLVGDLEYTCYAYRDRGAGDWISRLEMEPFLQLAAHF